uniref:uncharacterized protein LOC122601337 n=1 Tax=Erigeron canadensis TaxID=72917 RepID=UPI001CB9C80C|nr:uncharacterized protein LOC122601337 [Erigeron canadensis]
MTSKDQSSHTLTEQDRNPPYHVKGKRQRMKNINRISCFTCREKGHVASICPQKGKSSRSRHSNYSSDRYVEDVDVQLRNNKGKHVEDRSTSVSPKKLSQSDSPERSGSPRNSRISTSNPTFTRDYKKKYFEDHTSRNTSSNVAKEHGKPRSVSTTKPSNGGQAHNKTQKRNSTPK